MAAMNHFLLDRSSDPNESDIGRFGQSSVCHILKKMLACDPCPSHYQARVYGGAAVLKTVSRKSNVGEDNIEVAMEILAANKIRVIHTEIGGGRGRRIEFNTAENIINCRFTGEIPRGKKSSPANPVDPANSTNPANSTA
jgi:chemotaxis receptor (MCP) glutamine deamidase CheD